MVYFCQLFLNIDNVILKLYTSLCQKPKCTLFAWSTVGLPETLLGTDRMKGTKEARKQCEMTLPAVHKIPYSIP